MEREVSRCEIRARQADGQIQEMKARISRLNQRIEKIGKEEAATGHLFEEVKNRLKTVVDFRGDPKRIGHETGLAYAALDQTSQASAHAQAKKVRLEKIRSCQLKQLKSQSARRELALEQASKYRQAISNKQELDRLEETSELFSVLEQRRRLEDSPIPTTIPAAGSVSPQSAQPASDRKAQPQAAASAANPAFDRMTGLASWINNKGFGMSFGYILESGESLRLTFTRTRHNLVSVKVETESEGQRRKLWAERAKIRKELEAAGIAVKEVCFV